MEIWKDVPGYEGEYKVSSLGRIKSLKGQGKRKTYLNGHKTKLGYVLIALLKDGEKKQRFLHRIVADAFLDEDSLRKEINHKNGNRADNRLSNLERCTRSENMKHSYRVLGRKPPMQGRSGVNSKQVKCIETNKIYKSACAAARETGLRREGIRDSASGRHMTCGGFHWCFCQPAQLIQGGKK